MTIRLLGRALGLIMGRKNRIEKEDGRIEQERLAKFHREKAWEEWQKRGGDIGRRYGLGMLGQAQGVPLINCKCICCGHEYKDHPIANACCYSVTPGWGCYRCQGKLDRK